MWRVYLPLGVIAAGLLALLLTPAEAVSADCGTRSCSPVYAPSYYPSYYPRKKVVVIDPEVIAIPTIFFQYTPTVPVVVAPATPAPAAPAAAAAPASAPPGESEAARIDRLIRERMENFFRQQLASEGPPTVADGAALPPAAVAGPSPAAQALAILRSRCASCHTASTARGGAILFDAAGRYTPNVSKLRILELVRTAQMPLSARGNPSAPTAVPASEQLVLQQGL